MAYKAHNGTYRNSQRSLYKARCDLTKRYNRFMSFPNMQTHKALRDEMSDYMLIFQEQRGKQPDAEGSSLDCTELDGFDRSIVDRRKNTRVG